MHEIFLNAFFQRLWKDREPFRAAFELTGESYRKVKSRHTFRVELEGKGYFVKLHRGIGWREYFKNLLQFKLPVTDAGQEYRALLHLKEHGVDSFVPAIECDKIPTLENHPVMTTRYCLRRELGACLKEKNTKQKLPSPLFLRNGKTLLQVNCNCSRCEMTITIRYKN